MLDPFLGAVQQPRFCEECLAGISLWLLDGFLLSFFQRVSFLCLFAEGQEPNSTLHASFLPLCTYPPHPALFCLRSEKWEVRKGMQIFLGLRRVTVASQRPRLWKRFCILNASDAFHRVVARNCHRSTPWQSISKPSGRYREALLLFLNTQTSVIWLLEEVLGWLALLQVAGFPHLVPAVTGSGVLPQVLLLGQGWKCIGSPEEVFPI